MATGDKRFATYTVYNSITNSLNDEKYDFVKPFTFDQYLTYIFNLDDDDLSNFDKYREYLKNWTSVNKTNTSNVFNIKDIYIDFLNSIVISYSTTEERRFFNNLNLNDNESLTQAIPFYVQKIKDIISYYRNKRTNYKKDFRQIKNKGSKGSIENIVKNSVKDFYETIDSSTNRAAVLSGIDLNLQISIEEAYDTFNDYFDIDPDNNPGQSSSTNKINSLAIVDFEKALAEVLNDNDIKISELAPFNFTVQFDRVFDNYFTRDDFIDYDTSNKSNQNFNIFNEAELSRKFTGTDYFYLSTNETTYVSGNLFKADNEAENIFNINFPSIKSEVESNTIFESEAGLFFEPTKFSILRIDGEYNKNLKSNLEPNTLYVFPDPNKYGDIINLSTTKRLNPFDFYFKPNSYKNISSSQGRRLVKSDQRSHYFHSYESNDNRLYNLNNDSSLEKKYQDIKNTGFIVKNETDIYGNSFISVIPNKSIIRNVRTGSSFMSGIPFESGKTIDSSDNKYGVQDNVYNNTPLQKINATKTIYFNDIETNSLNVLSASKFKEVFSKITNVPEIEFDIFNNVTDFSVYNDTYSIQTSSYSIIDGFSFNGKVFSTIDSLPFILRKERINSDLSIVSNDCFVDNVIYKVKISPYNSLTGFGNEFYYEFFQYDTVKKDFSSIVDKNNTGLDFFKDNFFFTEPVVFNRIDRTHLTFNKISKIYTLSTSFKDLNNSLLLHVLNFTIDSNNINISKNVFYKDRYVSSPNNNVTGNKFTSLTGQFTIQSYPTGHFPGLGRPFLNPDTTGDLTRTIMFYSE